MYNLPIADNLNISALAGLFDSRATSYKYLYFLSLVESFVAELKVNQANDLLNLEILTNAYEKTIQPLSSLATIQGFSANWVYAEK
ncbi:hypothetical protein [Anabaenopsis elenkinii]|uniref:Uncharacterized protein n=1 Tax=Anabaenopsis elenkinii CCIBt3563 TaxID=2779889 RepID=A0A7S6RLN5_9CYAN|nr:hypothetical protein [Anabaenopsis elenkinii]QOV24807.1 hypothetical protein IM676_14960 [Anabaenopsis elenkinii CCIBt3563]